MREPDAETLATKLSKAILRAMFQSRRVVAPVLLLLLTGAASSWAYAGSTPPSTDMRASEAQILGYADPAWSFDGRRLAYIRIEDVPPPPPFVPNTRVVVANPDGTDATDVFTPEEGAYELAWSPRRNELVVNDGYQIVLLSGDGVRRQALGSGDEPSWSPDGTRIAVDGGAGPGRIAVLHRDGRKARPLTAWGREDQQSPSWSPDGRHVAFTFSRNEVVPRRRIAIVRATGGQAAGSGLRILATGADPVWSPDGRTLAYLGHRSVRLVTTVGRPRARILVPLASHSRKQTVAWSPDGSRLLLFAKPANRRLGIYVVRRDGSGLRLLAPASFGSGSLDSGRSPAWSPDGQKIAFSNARACGGRRMIFIMNADGSNQQQVTPCPSDGASR